MAVQLHSFATDADLAQQAARAWLDSLTALAGTGRAPTVALAGGRITGTFYDAVVKLATPAEVALVRGVEFFWGDERCVPPDSADSNFKLAKDRLFDPLAVPAARQHRVRGELDPGVAAERVTAELRQLAPFSGAGRPILDLVLLGMGEDGHVASLFPCAPSEVLESQAVYLPVIGPKPPPQRVSLSYATLREAAAVWVLVAGAGKAEPLRDALAGASSHGLGRMLAQRSQTTIFESVGLGSR
jgi:6-phosphogluconolactonase